MTRVPLTSPLAVLTTRTAQEHIMTTHSPTDLKPGDFVRHPTRLLNGLVRRSRVNRDEVVIMRLEENIDSLSDYDLTGWERVETVRPGHVQVRVDDLDPQTLSEWSQYAGCDLAETALLRVGCASIARQVEHGDPSPHWPAESAPPADEHDANATITLPCPDCGEAITRTAQVWTGSQRDRTLTWVTLGWHTCPPAQPDEPQEFGARVTVTSPDGTREKWLRSEVKTNEAWRAENGSEIGWFSATTWDNVIERGTVTLGWDDGEQP